MSTVGISQYESIALPPVLINSPQYQPPSRRGRGTTRGAGEEESEEKKKTSETHCDTIRGVRKEAAKVEHIVHDLKGQADRGKILPNRLDLFLCASTDDSTHSREHLARCSRLEAVNREGTGLELRRVTAASHRLVDEIIETLDVEGVFKV